MNAAAAIARGAVLIFVHADVRLPIDALDHVEAALDDLAVVGGAFRTWHVAERPTPLAPLFHLADLRSRRARLPYGDQALFVRAGVFAAAGGYPELPLLEDLALARTLWTRGRLRTVSARVMVSARRLEARPLYYTAVMHLIPALYRLGVPPAHLARLYPDVR